MDYTIFGEYTLPSLGKVYGVEVNPNIKIRSMTVSEEMKRLNNTERPYKTLADIIDDCLVENPGISAYDMCLGDFQFLLHRLRVVTYGSNYKISTKCPYCGFINSDEISLVDIPVSSYSEDIDKLFEIELPVSKHRVRLQMQTPRIVDEINARAKEIASKRKFSSSPKDSAFSLSIESFVQTVDGERLDVIKKSDFIKSLPMMDINYILRAEEKINEQIGINAILNCKCDICGLEYESPFRVTSEFFRPSVDDM